ncbi:hypothetical protein [Rheinheimera gaetbuli]
MQMLADMQLAQQQLAEIELLITQEQYIAATEQVGDLQKLLQQLFSQLNSSDMQSRQQLQQLSENFLMLLSGLDNERQKIKDSISQIAAVKSGNKISKTYQID